MNDNNQPFVVKDRRRFDSSGNERSDENNIRQQDDKVSEIKVSDDILKSNNTNKNAEVKPISSSEKSFNNFSDNIISDSKQGDNKQGDNKQFNGSSKNITESSKTASKDDSQKETKSSDSEIDFSSFIMSLASQALWQLGVMEPPAGITVTKDKNAAKETIEIISMLENKSKGNLDEYEEKLITEILHELRISFVRV